MLGLSVSTIEKIVFFALGFAIGNVFVPHNAFAYSYDRTPSGTQIDNQITISASWSDSEMDQPFSINDENFCLYISTNQQEIFGVPHPITGTDHTISSENIIINYISGEFITDIAVLGCETNEGWMSLETNTQIFLGYSGNNNVNIWGENGFFGSTSMIATVGEGVATTGGNIWGLFVFVGVLLAFVIALQLSVFTKRSFGTSTVQNSQAEGFGGSKYNKKNYSYGILDDDKSEKLRILDDKFVAENQKANENNDVKKSENLYNDYIKEKSKIIKE